MPDAISLGVGEPDFDTPWRIREEGIYSLERGRTFYTSNSGLKELRAEIVRYLDRKIGVAYDLNHEILVTVGGSEAIEIAMRACGAGYRSLYRSLAFCCSLYFRGRRTGCHSLQRESVHLHGKIISQKQLRDSGSSVPEQSDGFDMTKEIWQLTRDYFEGSLCAVG